MDDENPKKKKRGNPEPPSPQATVLLAPDAPLFHILKFMDPGLERPTCRKVCSVWHSTILNIEKSERAAMTTRIWMAPLKIINPDGWNDRLQADLNKVRQTTEDERALWGFEELTDHQRSMGFVDPIQLHFRTDVEPDDDGFCIIDGCFQRQSLASVRLTIKVCDVHYLIEERGQKYSNPFSFVGSYWRVGLGALEGDDDDWEFSVWLGYGNRFLCPPDTCNTLLQDPSKLRTKVHPLVRYKAWFSANSAPMRAWELNPKRSREPSLYTYFEDMDDESFPLSIAEFAFDPSACPDMVIVLDLEFLGYGYSWGEPYFVEV